MQKLRVPPRHSILLKANHYIIGKVRSMHTYYRCGKVTDTHIPEGRFPINHSTLYFLRLKTEKCGLKIPIKSGSKT